MAWLYGRKIVPESGQLITITKKGGEQMIPQNLKRPIPEVKEEPVSRTNADFIKILADTTKKGR